MKWTKRAPQAGHPRRRMQCGGKVEHGRASRIYEGSTNGGDEAMFRRYKSESARFSQPDPSDGSYDLSDPQSFNRYPYTENDPVNFTDPTELMMSSGLCIADMSFAECYGSDGRCCTNGRGGDTSASLDA